MLACVLGVRHADASPPDDWSIERRDDDRALVAQRLAKLRRSPFDRGQWKKLRRALGPATLHRRLEALADRYPRDIGLQVLLARAELDGGQPSAAAARLGTLDAGPRRWSRRVTSLRVDALVRAGASKEAVVLLVDRARRGRYAASDLTLAHTLSERAGLHATALAVAEQLVELAPAEVSALRRLARSAAADGQYRRADAALERSVGLASARERAGLIFARAELMTRAGDHGAASSQLWRLLAVRRGGGRATRAGWWKLFVHSVKQSGLGSSWDPKLRAWLDGGSAPEGAAWRALAQIRTMSGGDPLRAWEEALRVNPKDTIARRELIRALEADGQMSRVLTEIQLLTTRSPEELRFVLELAGRVIVNGDRRVGLAVAHSSGARGSRRAYAMMMLLEFYNAHAEPALALDVGRRWVRSSPRDPEARVALGEQLFEMNAVDEALEQWRRLPKLIRPRHAGWARHAEILSEHANAARGRRLRRDALLSLARALARSPKEPQYHRLKAILEEERRTYDLALESWMQVRRHATAASERVVRDEARTRIVELLVGVGLSRKDKERERVERACRETLGSGPPASALEAGRLLAELYTREDHHSAAVVVLRQLEGRFPSDPIRTLELASALRRTGQPDDLRAAIELLDGVAEADPARAGDALAQVSEIAFLVGDTDLAMAKATAAAHVGRFGNRALVRLGELHERRGELLQAKASYRAAIEAAPHEARARLRLAELQLLGGEVDQAVAAFESLLASGGPPDLMRSVGRRALDLAEATGNSGAFLARVIERAASQPNADEPRELLLDALDRVSVADAEVWLRAGGLRRESSRVATLRRALLTSLSGGSVGVRTRAAQQLGRMRLPDTAMALARVGANLTVHRETSPAIVEAYERAKVAAIVAAASLDDPTAVPLLVQIARHRGSAVGPRYAATWALANAADERARDTLHALVMPDAASDALLTSLACLGLARYPSAAADPLILHDLARHARYAKGRTTRRLCAYAELSLAATIDGRSIERWLEDEDPVLAAIALWRVGRGASADGAAQVQLLRRAIGPPGLPRDAAVAALSRALRAGGRASPPKLPWISVSGWKQTLRLWLIRELRSGARPVPQSSLDVLESAFEQAISVNLEGTPAQRHAARSAMRRCGNGDVGMPSAQQGPTLPSRVSCLAPLFTGSSGVSIGRSVDK